MIIPQERQIVSGTVARVVGLAHLTPGYWDLGCIMGSVGAVSTATMVARVTGGATLATFSSATNPSRQASQRIGIDTESTVEFAVSNSSNSVGAASVLEISADPVALSQVDVDVPISTDDALQVGTQGRRIPFVAVDASGSPVSAASASSMAVIYQAPGGQRGEWPASVLIAPYEFGTITKSGFLFESGLWRATGRLVINGSTYITKTKTLWVRA